MSLDFPAGETSISVFQLAELRQAEVPHAILDVREPAELEICRIENAIHIPMQQVPSRLAELPAGAPLIVICHHGMRSLRVVNFLHGAGIDNAINLDGGIDAWAAEIDPSISRY
jgi:rhodanese-related sulfurtransferase